jgi:hypothetical protein
MAQAQKNLFGIVTLIACILAWLPTEFALIAYLSKESVLPALLANGFGVICAVAIICALFSRTNRATAAAAAGSTIGSLIVAWLYGWAMFASMVGGTFISAVVFVLFVVAIIRYEDLEQPRR